MLETLRIKNFALIEDLEINWSGGLNVLTGETGAGKSIIIDALGLILGQRADTTFIRTGASESDIQGLFSMRGVPQVRGILTDQGIECEDDDLLVRRVVSGEGKSRCYINGNLTTVGTLVGIGEHLVDIHGQHEHQSLLKIDKHLEFLDSYGSLEGMRAEVTGRYNQLRGLESEISSLEQAEAEKRDRLSYVKHEIAEIDAANLDPKEEEDLTTRRKIVANHERLFSLSKEAYDLLYGGEVTVRPIYEQWITLLSRLRDIAEIDPSLREALAQCENIRYGMEDVADTLREYSASMEYDPQELEQIGDRLSLIQKLKRKYGRSVEEILSYRSDLDAELEMLSGREKKLSQLRKQADEVRKELSSLSIELSESRTKCAKKLEKKVKGEMSQLGMDKARFSVAVTHEPSDSGFVTQRGNTVALRSTGIDRVEFLIAPNVGEELKPLRKIASGGEMSRVMLALKTILASADKIATLIFDEIDAGIGGGIGPTLAQKLRSAAESHQVICITHLPHIAALAHSHLRVTKTPSGKRTITQVQVLAGEDRQQEIARMLGGPDLTDISLKHAKELLLKNKA